MAEYKIRSKVTARSLKVFKKHGLMDQTKKVDDLGLSLMEIYCDENELAELVNATFDAEITPKEALDFDLGLLSDGITDFLALLTDKSQRSVKSKKTS